MAAPSNRAIRYFGDYVLFGQIAEGAMGEVWFARQDSLNRPVAVKLIRAGALATAAEIERFRLEAQAAARLSHKNIVQVFEVGEHEGRHFFSMELIEGTSLARQIKEGGWRIDDANAGQRQRIAARLLVTVARAIHHAHQRGVLHRDIKPANILIDEPGEPHVSDFGLAKLLDAGSSLTAPGAVIGTLSYMSPEQAQGKSAEATTAADIYSLGAVLYELLAGQPPFQGDNWALLLRQIVEDEVPVEPLQRFAGKPGTISPSADLITICLKCLEKSPARRYASAEALAEDLERWLRGEPISARPVGDFERAWKWVRRHPVTAGLSVALAVALLVGLGTTFWQWRRAEMQWTLTALAHTRLQLQRAEDFLSSDRPYLALPILARVLRDEPRQRVAQERLVNVFNQRGFLASIAPPGKVPSTVVQLALRVAHSPDGLRVATATNAQIAEIELWDARSGVLLHTFANAHLNVIRSVAFSPDGQRLVSSSADGSAKVWDAKTFRPVTTLPHSSPVQFAEFAPDGQRALTASRDGVARLWHVQTGELLWALPPQRVPLTMARYHPDGSLIALGTDDGAVQLWTGGANRSRRCAESLVLSNAVWNLAFRSNTLVVTLDDGTIHTLAWTHRSGLLAPLEGERRGMRRRQTAPAPSNPLERITNVLGHAASQLHSSTITSVDVMPDGRLFATASLDKSARIWNARTGAAASEPLIHTAPVNCVRFSPDGLRLATSTPGNAARVWDVESGQPLTDWIEFEKPVAAVAFSSDGTEIETSSGESWPIHLAHAQAPLWLADLAEAIAGAQLDRVGRAIPPTPFAVVRERLARSAETNAMALWAKQFLASP